MRRLECLRAIYKELESCIVVTIMGAVAAELQSLGHRPNFFYLQHAMGLASSTGLGLALCVPERKVVVLDGDGSLLMNLGGLSTLARYRPSNMIEVVFDNESLLSVGGFRRQLRRELISPKFPALLESHAALRCIRSLNSARLF